VGAGGQLGRALVARLGTRAAWVGDRDELDIRDGDAVSRLVQDVRPDVLLNASAYNAVDAAETRPGDAIAVNTLGPRHLAWAARQAGALFVHVSTDYVFDGTKATPYVESDAARPLNAYGASKLAGEVMVAAAGGPHIIARTSAVLGVGGSPDKGGSFVERIVEQARAGKPLRVVSDQTFSPTYADDLAAALLALVEAEARGIFHVTNAGSCSWHELAEAALRQAGLEQPVEKIRAADLALPARRPAYSVLANERYREAGLPPLRRWEDTLADLLR
jgi:dTDP-4-dehydrorhamnose reductase